MFCVDTRIICVNGLPISDSLRNVVDILHAGYFTGVEFELCGWKVHNLTTLLCLFMLYKTNSH